MSGGVDSAVALLRAGSGAVGVTLRLWQDPAAPDTERACCSPAAVAAARATCHALGLPHVTLDLREEFKSTIVDPFAHAYEAGETPNPCMRCNGAFRFDALVALRRACRSRRALDGPLRADRRARRPHARRARRGRAEGPVVHARGRRSAPPREGPLPARRADEGRDARRGREGGARGRAACREPGGMLPRRRRLPRVPRAPGSPGGTRRRRRHRRGSARVARRLLEVHARSAARPGGERRPTAVRAADRRGDEHGDGGRARPARHDDRRGPRPPPRSRSRRPP